MSDAGWAPAFKNFVMGLLFYLSCLGLTFIITLSYICEPLRIFADGISPKLGKLFKCPQCMGFWVGIFIRALFMWHGGEFANLQWIDLYNVCYGFASSFICYVSYLLLKFFIEKYD